MWHPELWQDPIFWIRLGDSFFINSVFSNKRKLVIHKTSESMSWKSNEKLGFQRRELVDLILMVRMELNLERREWIEASVEFEGANPDDNNVK